MEVFYVVGTEILKLPRGGEPSMEAGPKGKKKSRPIIFILTCPTKIYTKT